MKYDPAVHHRRSIRLQGYDYSQAGAYFVTICTQNQDCLFGNIVDGEMRLNEAGKMVGWWHAELENKFSNINCDKFVCMPNHVHFVVATVRPDVGTETGMATSSVRADLCVRPDSTGMVEHAGPPLHRVVQWFKTMTTNGYIRGVKQNGWPQFPGKLWQRNYWEHIVRNESELNQIREYIENNPTQWELDKLYRCDVGTDVGMDAWADVGATAGTGVGADLCVRPVDLTGNIHHDSHGPTHGKKNG